MPKIPTYTQQTSAPTAQYGSMDPGLINDRGAQQLAAGVANLGKFMQQREDEDSKLWSLNAMADFRRETMETFEASKQNVEPGAPDFAKGQNDAYEERFKSFVERAPTRNAKIHFEAAAREYQSSVFAHAIGFEAGERQRFRAQSHLDAAEKESAEVYNSLDSLQSWKAIVQPRLDAVAGTSISPEMRQKIIDQTSKHFSKSIVQGDGAKDPKLAIQRIDDGTYSKLPGFNLYGDELAQLRRGFAAKTEHIDADWAAGVKYAVSEWKDKLVSGNFENGFELKVPEDDIKKAYGPAQYRQALDEVAAYKTLVPYLKGAAALDANNLAKRSNQLARDVADGKISQLAASSVRETFTKVAEGILKERSTNPGAAADRAAAALFGTDYSAQQGPDKYLMRKMAAKEIGLPEHASVLLSKEEAKSMVDQLEKSPPDQVQQQLTELHKMLSAKPSNSYNWGGSPVTGDQLYNSFMAELYGAGLNKGFAVVEFTKDSKYGNVILQAAKLKTAEPIEGSVDKEYKKQVRATLDSAAEFKSFAKVLSLSSSGGAEYVTTFKDTLYKAALLVGGSAESADAVMKDMIKETITKNLSFNGTYYVPTTDPRTGQVLDKDDVDAKLKTIRDNWMTPTGNKFAPRVQTSKAAISGGMYHQREVATATNYVWVNMEDGSGVYLAVPTVAGKVEPILDGKNNRFEIPFADIGRTYQYVAAPSRNASGKIK